MTMTTNQTPGPTWYDILGVDREATPEQVKAAWRAAPDKFEPGSGTSQFRLVNEAADVLLDPARREAYDAELDAGPGVDLAKGEVVEAPAPEAAEGADDAEVADVSDADRGAALDAGPDAAGVVPLDGPDGEPAEPAARSTGFLGRLAAIPV